MNPVSNPKSAYREAINRANAQHSTGPRTDAGKRRSSLNAFTHGLTSRMVVLPNEDPAVYQRHAQEFFDEYRPQGPTEKHLVQELVDTAWRLNRIPALEADVLTRAAYLQFDAAAVAFVNAHRLLGSLSINSQRLSRQFQKALDQLRGIQAERRRTEERDLKRAAALLEMQRTKAIAYDDADGFIFSNSEIETFGRPMCSPLPGTWQLLR